MLLPFSNFYRGPLSRTLGSLPCVLGFFPSMLTLLFESGIWVDLEVLDSTQWLSSIHRFPFAKIHCIIICDVLFTYHFASPLSEQGVCFVYFHIYITSSSSGSKSHFSKVLPFYLFTAGCISWSLDCSYGPPLSEILAGIRVLFQVTQSPKTIFRDPFMSVLFSHPRVCGYFLLNLADPLFVWLGRHVLILWEFGVLAPTRWFETPIAQGNYYCTPHTWITIHCTHSKLTWVMWA